MGAIGWARADSNTRQVKAAKNGSLVRRLCVIINVVVSIIPECGFSLCSWLLVTDGDFQWVMVSRGHAKAEKGQPYLLASGMGEIIFLKGLIVDSVSG